MSDSDMKRDLHDYLRGARETLVWKLEGLGEYDIRRPLTLTGTNLLGLVKHDAAMNVLYFGEVFGRTHDVSLPWLTADAGQDADKWARPDETREHILDLYRATWELTDATIDALPLEALGHVWWWGDDPVTLHRVLVHTACGTQRHAGHADILRESVDGAVGMLRGSDNLHHHDPESWRELHDRIEADARLAADR